MRAPASLLSGLLLTVGCGAEALGPTYTLESGRFRVMLTPAQTLELRRGEELLLALPAADLQLGVQRALDPAASYDPYWLEYQDELFQPDPPRDLMFLSPASAAARQEGAALVLALSYAPGLDAELRVELAADHARCVLLPRAANVAVAYVRLRPTFSASDAYYGLGEWPDVVNHRGKLRPMQIEPDLGLESANNEAHVPVPLLISSRGFGLFVESRRYGLFDLARKDPAKVEITYGTAEASADGLRFHLLLAEHPLDVTRAYYARTGSPLLPAEWAYGPWIWRNENRDQAEVLEDVRTLRALDLPTSALWIDRPYARAVNTFDFDPARYPDPAAMIGRIHDAGLRLALWHTPYLEERAEPLRAEAAARGFFPPETGVLLNTWGPPIDLTHPEAYAWWQGLIRRYTALGIEGFKLDYAEDVVGGLGGARTPWRFASGEDERTMHHGYTVLYHQVYAETLPATGGFLLGRAGRFGDQVNVSVIWPGDLDATMTRHRQRFTPRGAADPVNGVGGLPASVAMALNLGPSGFPFFGADTGGYRHGPPDLETYVRWFQQTALSSVMQVGDSTSQPPWVFTPENGRSMATVDLYRQFARLHLRLFPYVWSHARRIAEDGRPLMRPLGLAHPELGQHPADTYLLGDHLLVAPVVEAGATTRTLWLPPGEWIDWFDGAVHPGGQEISVAAPLERLPLFLRRGAFVPLLREGIDTLAPTVTSTIESYANDAGELTVRLWRGEEARFQLFDGTRLTDAGVLSIEPGGRFVRGARFELLREARPALVLLDGAPLAEVADLGAQERGWRHDAGTLWVRVPPGAHQLELR